ncbi:putative DNA ligase I [Ascobolus immersus RN42]|uniref:DNA ligase n=1 Tax=Ascobolus immersus RN42 TaxID=1160509 RepID=A0A3N4IDD4_ASCIM|nr:putative DNA ligase I [Ascobolus immersus RN42]
MATPSAPTKKRKAAAGVKKNATPSKGILYFFNKQTNANAGHDDGKKAAQTDEELARELQDKWNKEDGKLSKSSVSTDLADSSQGLKRKADEVDGLEESASKKIEVFVGKDRLEEELEEEESIAIEDGINNPSKNLGLGPSGNKLETESRPDLEAKPESTQPKPAPRNPFDLSAASTAPDNTSEINTIPFDHDPFTFDPTAYSHLPTPIPYALLAHAFTLVNSTRSRIKITDSLTNLLRLLILHDPSSLLAAVWLTTNDVAPPYEGVEYGIGSQILSKAIQNTSGISAGQLRTLFNKMGDAGDVAFEAKSKQRTLGLRKPAALTIKGVFDTVIKIARTKGQGSQDAKRGLVERLLREGKGEEVRYLTRTLVQHLRIGAVKTTMLIALARAFSLTKPNGAQWETMFPAGTTKASKEKRQEVFGKAEEILKQCFARRPNYNDIVPALIDGGVEELNVRCPSKVHIPLKPMLGSITRDLSEMLIKLQGRDFACEYKYDGQRAQIHCDDDGNISIFSRHLELMTSKYPDLVALIPKVRTASVKSFILEGEVVAIDRATGQLRTFQTLSNRGRKDVLIKDVEIDVCFFGFDCMMINGEEMMSRPFRERRELLRSLFTEVPGQFTWVKSIDAVSADEDVVLDFFKSALKEKCEGIMVKVLDNLPEVSPDAEVMETSAVMSSQSKTVKGKVKKATESAANGSGGRRKALLSTYEPDKRLESWLKVKKDYDAAADSLDLVPIGAWHGSGRKNKWWSPILLAVRNPDTGSLEAVCKCMSGFTDDFYKALREKYNPDILDDSEETEEDPAPANQLLTSSTKPSYYESPLRPDVWFIASEVWEVKFADITLSPVYTAGLGLVDPERGMSIRFPRFIRKRDDKSVEEASTRQFLASLWEKQESREGQKKADGLEWGDGEGVDADFEY